MGLLPLPKGVYYLSALPQPATGHGRSARTTVADQLLCLNQVGNWFLVPSWRLVLTKVLWPDHRASPHNRIIVRDIQSHPCAFTSCTSSDYPSIAQPSSPHSHGP
jgi:hypothetical protein